MIKYFSLDLDAQQISILTKLNLNNINRYLKLIRHRIAELCESETPFKGEIEVDESYFGAKIEVDVAVVPPVKCRFSVGLFKEKGKYILR